MNYTEDEKIDLAIKATEEFFVGDRLFQERGHIIKRLNEIIS